MANIRVTDGNIETSSSIVKRRRTSDANREKALALYNSGKSIAEVSRLVGKSAWIVRRWLKDCNTADVSMISTGKQSEIKLIDLSDSSVKTKMKDRPKVNYMTRIEDKDFLNNNYQYCDPCDVAKKPDDSTVPKDPLSLLKPRKPRNTLPAASDNKRKRKRVSNSSNLQLDHQGTSFSNPVDDLSAKWTRMLESNPLISQPFLQIQSQMMEKLNPTMNPSLAQEMNVYLMSQMIQHMENQQIGQSQVIKQPRKRRRLSGNSENKENVVNTVNDSNPDKEKIQMNVEGIISSTPIIQPRRKRRSKAEMNVEAELNAYFTPEYFALHDYLLYQQQIIGEKIMTGIYDM